MLKSASKKWIHKKLSNLIDLTIFINMCIFILKRDLRQQVYSSP